MKKDRGFLKTLSKKDKKKWGKEASNFHPYQVTLYCGCCTATVWYRNDEEAQQAMEQAGLGVVTLLDGIGRPVSQVDTFYSIKGLSNPAK